MGIKVGIDLGTTFSAVARVDEITGRPIIIKNDYNSTITPSVLCFQQNGHILHGQDAKDMQAQGDINTASFFKRSIGNPSVSADYLGRSYTPTDLSAILLRKLKEEAEAQIGETIDAAVITVPAYFSDIERNATIQAGKQAGLEVIAIINEPTAATLAYGLNEKGKEQIIMIYDLGGGTFDVTIARVNDNEVIVLGSDGNHELGGKDWDDCIARYLVDQFYEKYKVEINDPGMTNTLLVAAETAKKQLTIRDTTTVNIQYQNINGQIEITNEIFESISQFLIGTTKDVTQSLLESINLSWRDIDGVILVGGSTRMKMIQKYVETMSGKPPLKGVHVDEAVALGAAIRANMTLQGKPTKTLQGAKAITDATAHSLGMISISENGERFVNSKIIPKNHPIPASQERPFSFRTRSKDNELEVYVLQGEHYRPLNNKIINKYVITKIKKTNQPNSIINVTYHYTSDGVIQVTAKQAETGKDLPIRVEPIPADMSWTDGHPKDQPGQEAVMPDVEIMLAIDLSGSMSGRPITESKKAMHGFVKQMNPDHVKIGIMAFADRVNCVLEPTNNYKAVTKAIDTVDHVSVGGANRGEPFTLTLQKLRKGELRYLIVLTDGCWSKPAVAISVAKECHKAGIDIMALGFGSADRQFLKDIASIDAFADFTRLEELGSSFSKIAQAIGDNTGLRSVIT
ncbi:MAG: Hsp70 family protein [Defluviitaleaceae bacterium]|nr:Hsp70 family protein [Defluviitaleaceae bacterium]